MFWNRKAGDERVFRRLEEMEDLVRKLKREWEEHDIRWQEMRNRCKRMLDRAEKAYGAMDGETPAQEPGPEVPLTPTTLGATPDRLARIRAQLAERGRAKGGNQDPRGT